MEIYNNPSLNNNEFHGIYFVKINDNLYVLYKKIINLTNNGWIMNNFVNDIQNIILGRFIIPNF